MKGNKTAMYKKFLKIILSVSICISVAACGSVQPQNISSGETETLDEKTTDGTETQGENQKPLLDADASDEELLEVLKDDIHIVSNDAYEETVAELMEHTDAHSGQLYQLEGIYMADNQDAYLTSLAGGGENRLPLKYLTADIEDGEPIRVTGIVNQDEKDGKMVAALEVIVTEPLEK